MFNADVKQMTLPLTFAKRLTRVWGACTSSLEYLKVIDWDIKAVVATPAADGIAAHQADPVGGEDQPYFIDDLLIEIDVPIASNHVAKKSLRSGIYLWRN
jgi:hypothetical protein